MQTAYCLICTQLYSSQNSWTLKKRIILTRIRYTAEGEATVVSVDCCDDVWVDGLQCGMSVLDRRLICIYGWVWPRHCRCPRALSRIRTLNVRLSDFRYSFQTIRYCHDILSRCNSADWQRLVLRERSRGASKQEIFALIGALTLSLPLILSSLFLLKWIVVSCAP